MNIVLDVVLVGKIIGQNQLIKWHLHTTDKNI